jgi:hypothetical protein
MAHRQTETKKRSNGHEAHPRQEPVMETVWESFPVLEVEPRRELPFDGRKTERDFEN